MTTIEKKKAPRKTAAKKRSTATKRPAAKKAAKRPIGRPSKYTQELVDRICELIATSDIGLPRLCEKHPELPHVDTIRLWTWRHPEFHAQYMRAREAQQEWMADRAQAIADDGINDTYIDENGNAKVDHDVIARSRLRVDTIKWQASKLAPKRFGEKLDVNHGGQEGNPLSLLLQQVQGTPLRPVGDDDATDAAMEQQK